jgi:hypothetical protein
MKKYILIYLGMIMAVSIGSSFSGQYYGQQGGYGQPYNGGNQPCSRSRLEYKHQKNLLESQQEMAACHQGYAQYCEKAQKDYQDAQRYLMEYQNCPYP